jgi:DNA-directed RNA polymerase specialized sigma24 family protein
MNKPKDINLIFNWLTENKARIMQKFVYKRLYNMNKENAEDFYQDLYVIMADKNLDKLMTIYYNGDIEAYVYKIIRNSIGSETSRFHATYIKPLGDEYVESKDNRACDVDYTASLIREIDTECHLFLDKVRDELDRVEGDSPLSYYNKQIFNLYYKEGHTFRHLSEKLGIPVTSLFNTVTRTREDLLKLFKDDINNINEKLNSYYDQ